MIYFAAKASVLNSLFFEFLSLVTINICRLYELVVIFNILAEAFVANSNLCRDWNFTIRPQLKRAAKKLFRAHVFVRVCAH